MTVYVDDARIPARVGRVSGLWSHLTADTVPELMEFAVSLGLKPGWLQARCRSAMCPAVTVTGRTVCAHFHFDLVETRREAALRHGARPIELRQMGALTSARRARFRVLAQGLQERAESGGGDT